MEEREERVPIPPLDRSGRLPFPLDGPGEEDGNAEPAEGLAAAADEGVELEDEGFPEDGSLPEDGASFPGFEAWIETVTGELPFPPDRKRVEQELTDHYLDRRDELHARGLSWWDAELAAVEAMGDPVETGRLLRAVHKPWLGWLLRIARVVLFIVLVIGVVHFSDLTGYVSGQISLRQWRERYLDYGADAATPIVLELGSSDAEAALGDYRISVYAAGNCPFAKWEVGVPYYPTEAFAVLRFAAPPWTSPEFSLWVEDDLGCVYLSGYTERGLSAPAPDRVGMMTEDERYDKLTLQFMGQDLFASYYLLEIWDYPGYSGARHMDIHIQMGNQERVLPVSFGPRKIIGEAFDAPPEDVTAWAEAWLDPLAEDDQTEIRYLRKGSAEPVSGDGIEVSVPRAREGLWYRTNLVEIPWDREAAPKGEWRWQPTEELQQFDMDVTVCHSELEFVLALRGPSEKLPLTCAELLSRLTLTGSNGAVYPLAERPEEMGVSYDPTWSLWMDRYEDLVLYDVTVVLDGPSEFFDLSLRLEDETVPLQIVMGEEAMP